MIVLRYEDGNISVVLVEWLWIWEILVLKFASHVACTYGDLCVTNLKHEVFFDCHPYEWRSGTSDGLFLPIYPPRSMHVMLGFWWHVDFCNKYVSSLWLMLSPWIIRTLTFPSLLASSVPCISFLTLRVGANFAGAYKPCDMICSITHKPPYIYLKTATIPTYYGISISIAKFIAMQLFTVSFIMTHFIIVILPCMIM